MTEQRRLRILLIEDDAPLMRTMAWALSEEGWLVEVVSKRHALQMHGLTAPDVAVFNMQATAQEKTTYQNQLRMLNPDCVMIDVDEFVVDGGSVRDSGADAYTARPLNLDAVTAMIRQTTGTPPDERQALRDGNERELHGELDADSAHSESTEMRGMAADETEG